MGIVALGRSGEETLITSKSQKVRLMDTLGAPLSRTLGVLYGSSMGPLCASRSARFGRSLIVSTVLAVPLPRPFPPLSRCLFSRPLMPQLIVSQSWMFHPSKNESTTTQLFIFRREVACLFQTAPSRPTNIFSALFRSMISHALSAYRV
jgi:hypothetical protein